MQKNISQAIFFVGVIFFNSLSANSDARDYIKISGREVFIPKKLGDIKLYKDSNGFHVIKNGKIHDIQKYFCDPMLRKMSDKQLLRFLGRNKPKIVTITPEELDQINNDTIIEITGDEKDTLISKLFGNTSGYISISQMSDGAYKLVANIRLLGGGKGYDLKVFIVPVIGTILVATTGALVGAASGSLIAIGLEESVLTYASLGSAIGGGIGGITGVIISYFQNKKNKNI